MLYNGVGHKARTFSGSMHVLSNFFPSRSDRALLCVYCHVGTLPCPKSGIGVPKITLDFKRVALVPRIRKSQTDSISTHCRANTPEQAHLATLLYVSRFQPSYSAIPKSILFGSHSRLKTKLRTVHNFEAEIIGAIN